MLDILSESVNPDHEGYEEHTRWNTHIVMMGNMYPEELADYALSYTAGDKSCVSAGAGPSISRLGIRNRPRNFFVKEFPWWGTLWWAGVLQPRICTSVCASAVRR